MKYCFISSQFPNLDDMDNNHATPFLYNYAKYLTELGNEVTVIHCMREYPKIFSFLAKFLKKIGIHRLDKYLFNVNMCSDKEYVFDGIRIFRFTYKKYIPHSSAARSQINKLYGKVIKSDAACGCDVIISDFLDPSLPIASKLKKKYSKKVGQVIHVTDYSFLKKMKPLLSYVDFWLFRAKSQYDTVSQYVRVDRQFIMPSGIEEEVLPKEPVFRSKVKNLLFVGRIEKDKGIDTILTALSKLPENRFFLTVVGDGSETYNYKQMARSLGIDDCIRFIGKVPHSDVFGYMQKSDALIMISHETFGMVYVEAMSQGCIPIGASGEGIDGIVKDGENGFLCPLKDSQALADKLSYISEIDCTEISRAAYATACEMTNKNLAEKFDGYIKSYEI
ncbi:MAG: glycosyltransferase [Eubacteriales bacterium]|nr:glycosyltransferase [Eubacteriales bacterium]